MTNCGAHMEIAGWVHFALHMRSILSALNSQVLGPVQYGRCVIGRVPGFRFIWCDVRLLFLNDHSNVVPFYLYAPMTPLLSLGDAGHVLICYRSLHFFYSKNRIVNLFPFDSQADWPSRQHRLLWVWSWRNGASWWLPFGLKPAFEPFVPCWLSGSCTVRLV